LAKISKIMERTQRQKEKKLQEIALLDAQQNQLAALLSSVGVLDGETINEQLKIIAKAFKMNRKILADSTKRRAKEMKKERKREQREERKALREQRKRDKAERARKLKEARSPSLPAAINGDTLSVHIDGYNLIGCDSECRKMMRSRRRGGMRASRQRLSRLVTERLLDRAGALGLGYALRVTLWFDGKGQGGKCGDGLDVVFSGHSVVDDRLVELFGGNEANDVMVVTSDRELTLRLHGLGVGVMKSGTFYNAYLKEKATAEEMEVDDDDEDEDQPVGDQKEPEPEADDDAVADEFGHFIANKVDRGQNDDTNDEDTDCAPDEMEGSGSHYESPSRTPGDEGEDSDFMEIFGDDVETEATE